MKTALISKFFSTFKYSVILNPNNLLFVILRFLKLLKDLFNFNILKIITQINNLIEFSVKIKIIKIAEDQRKIIYIKKEKESN